MFSKRSLSVQKTRANPPRARLEVELLESRLALSCCSIGVSFADGVLSVTGSQCNDVFWLYADDSGNVLLAINDSGRVYDHTITGNPTLWNTHKVVMDGGSGDDQIALHMVIRPNTNDFPILAWNGCAVVSGGEGSDWLSVWGAKSIEIHGGGGSDYLESGIGDSLLDGGEGDDQLVARFFGNNVLRGGPGYDDGGGSWGNDMFQTEGVGDLDPEAPDYQVWYQSERQVFERVEFVGDGCETHASASGAVMEFIGDGCQNHESVDGEAALAFLAGIDDGEALADLDQPPADQASDAGEEHAPSAIENDSFEIAEGDAADQDLPIEEQEALAFEDDLLNEGLDGLPEEGLEELHIG